MTEIPDDIREKANEAYMRPFLEGDGSSAPGTAILASIAAALLAEREASREAAIEECASWHEKNGRMCREAANDDPRLNRDDRARALDAAKHHNASATGLRYKLIQEKRRELLAAFPEVKP